MSRISLTAYGTAAGGTYAHFKLLVDGKVVGQATTTATKQLYTFDVALDPSKPHAIAIQFDNDACIGGADRNLFVSSLNLDGRPLPLTGDGSRYLVSSGGTEVVRSFSGAMPWSGSLVVDVPPSAPAPAPAPVPLPPATGTLALKVTGDHWNGAPQFIVLVDGKQVGGIQTTTARRVNGEWQEIRLAGEFGSSPGKVEVKFINDAWGGAGKDRNLYVDAIELNGKRYEGEAASNTASAGAKHPTAAVMAVNGTLTFAIPAPASAPAPAPVTVSSDVTRILASTEQHLILTGTAAADGTGNALANRLTGNSAANVLDGLGGADEMLGGAGNDTYVVDNAADKVIELASQGTDTVRASSSYVLGSHVENLVLTGTGSISGTGNDLDNRIVGNGADNVLTGAAGNDTLDGGAGADSMRGGAGDDVYVVDNAGDSIVELLNEGVDSIQSTVALTLGANIENLFLAGTAGISGTGNELGNKVVGNAAANVLDGRAGDDELDGGAGDDRLIGGSGNDRLEGGTGIDIAAFLGRAADYRVSTSNGITTVVALNGTDGTDTLSGVEELSFADRAIDLTAPSAPNPPAALPSDPDVGVKLTRYDGTIRTTHDGQVIERLDIYSGGTAIEVLHKNVIIRDVRVHHADGDGIRATAAHNLRIENVEVINTDPPNGQNPEESDQFINIEIVKSLDVTIRNVTVRDGATGIYLVESAGATLDHVDGYDFHGPFPRGQFVQFNRSPDGSLTNFYVHNDAATSHVEDIVSVYASQNVRIENGVIDGNNSRTGVAVMFEDGSTGGLVRNVDAIHQANGGFSAYNADVDFIDVRTFDSINYDQGRGLPSSNGVHFVVNGTGVTFDDATYTRPANPGNIIWQPIRPELLDVKADPYATAMSHEAFVNDWNWLT